MSRAKENVLLKELMVVPPKGARGIQSNITQRLPHMAVASELIYASIMLSPSCKDVKKFLNHMKLLHHTGMCINLDLLHDEIVKIAPLASLGRKDRKSKMTLEGGANMSLRRCVVLGLMVLLLTVSTYVITMRSEISFYQNQCANIITLFDPKRRNALTFFEQLDKFSRMAFNKQHIQYCEGLQQKYGNMALSLATQLNDTMSSLRARITLSITIVSAISGILSQGVHALVCLAAKWLGNIDELCDQMCDRGTKHAHKSEEKKRSAKETPEEEFDDAE